MKKSTTVLTMALFHCFHAWRLLRVVAFVRYARCCNVFSFFRFSADADSSISHANHCNIFSINYSRIFDSFVIRSRCHSASMAFRCKETKANFKMGLDAECTQNTHQLRRPYTAVAITIIMIRAFNIRCQPDIGYSIMYCHHRHCVCYRNSEINSLCLSCSLAPSLCSASCSPLYVHFNSISHKIYSQFMSVFAFAIVRMHVASSIERGAVWCTFTNKMCTDSSIGLLFFHYENFEFSILSWRGMWLSGAVG